MSKSYGAFTAVDNVDLKIYKGEMFALVGASGCGKTTLLRMLAGFAEPSSGRISIDGVDMSGVPPHERPVNMMFQSYALFPHMTVERNVGYGMQPAAARCRNPQARASRRRSRWCSSARSAQRKPHQLSGGQRQRVALARALIRRPKVLLLDEPLSALDKKLREQTQFELMDLQYKVGITFIVVTHDQDEAMALATRIAVMDRGQVVQVGTPVGDLRVSRAAASSRTSSARTNLFEGTVRACEAGLITVRCAETGCDLLVDDAGSFSSGQRVWVALRPEKMRLGKRADDGRRASISCAARSGSWVTSAIARPTRSRPRSGKLVTVFAQNERRTAEAGHRLERRGVRELERGCGGRAAVVDLAG